MKTIKLVSSVIFILLLVSTFVFITIREYSLVKYPKYTTGTTKSIYYTGSGLKKIEYTYVVNGLEYSGSASYKDGTVVPGGVYWVKFSWKIPDRSTLLQENLIKNIPDIPEGGIDKLPFKNPGIPVISDDRIEKLPLEQPSQFDSLYKRIR
jgi:hypothetical protein